MMGERDETIFYKGDEITVDIGGRLFYTKAIFVDIGVDSLLFLDKNRNLVNTTEKCTVALVKRKEKDEIW